MDELRRRIESYLRYLKIPRTIEPQDGHWVEIPFDFRRFDMDREGLIYRIQSDIHHVIHTQDWTEYYQVRVITNPGRGIVIVEQGVR